MTGPALGRALLGLLIVAGTTAAVAAGVRASGGDIGRHVVIVAPADGSEVPLGRDVGISAQGFDPTGVRRWEIRAGDEVVARASLGDDGPTHVAIDGTWRPTTVGSVVIEVRVEGANGARPAGRVTVAVTTTATSRASSTSTSRSTTTAEPGTTTTAGDATTSTIEPTSTTAPTADTTAAPTTASTRETTTTAPPTTSPPTTAPSTTSSSTTTTLPDRTPPRVGASHSPAQPVDSDTITFTVTATDDRQLAQVEVWAQGPGENQPALLAICTTSPCAVQRRYPAGTVSYFGVARDEATNEARTTTRRFDVTPVIN